MMVYLTEREELRDLRTRNVGKMVLTILAMNKYVALQSDSVGTYSDVAVI